MADKDSDGVFQSAREIFAGMRRNTMYHPPYVRRHDVKFDSKVYAIKSHDGVRKSVVWFNEDAFDEALSRANSSVGRGVPLEKTTLVVKKGTTLWETMIWSEKLQSYHQSLAVGVYERKEDATAAVHSVYETHRRYLQEIARMASESIDKVGLPEKEFVDFESPSEYMEFV
ncbi:MAG: hypothetical protein MJZ81_09640 [Bacteroidales bacterium]|nr:hypothetical protein [Bacteroidales bacterium]